MTDKPVYMIVMLDVADTAAFMQDYAGPLQVINAKCRVEAVVASPSVKVLEGSYDKSITVVLRFPSQEAQAAWYADVDYQPLLNRRHELSDTSTSVVLLAVHSGVARPTVPIASGHPHRFNPATQTGHPATP